MAYNNGLCKSILWLGIKANLEKFIQSQVKRAENTGKNGVSVITDVGSFHLFEIVDKLIEYELSLPSKYDIKLKRFCVYNKNNFDQLTEQHKHQLFSHHSKSVIVRSCQN